LVTGELKKRLAELVVVVPVCESAVLGLVGVDEKLFCIK